MLDWSYIFKQWLQVTLDGTNEYESDTLTPAEQAHNSNNVLSYVRFPMNATTKKKKKKDTNLRNIWMRIWRIKNSEKHSQTKKKINK